MVLILNTKKELQCYNFEAVIRLFTQKFEDILKKNNLPD